MGKYTILIFVLSALLFLQACQKKEDSIIPETETVTETETETETETDTGAETETETDMEANNVLSEIKLESDGAGNTYELINSVFAPNYNVIEAPDCNHEEFGRHIDEVFDTELNKNVFRFFIHKTPDNDRCINFDRQRNEIKTYDKSPDELLGVENEKVKYSWKFKLPSDFQSSSNFTHIHQLKAVGGSEESMPLITFTTRKGSPDQLELRYAETTSQVTLTKVDLTPFKGKWVEVVETVIFGEKGIGMYEVEIKDIVSQNILFSYLNDTIRMWKTNADFIRPKWGIYRSLLNESSLKDETVLFADFEVVELKNN
ncbi:heparin lyase I family protein [Lutibacter sp. TH_r2]|uniref:heparin lyase I family protein n=1 Tax=Lutibacter sp. TH_r2 TaxID=3082083 RepID=UPI002953BA04|nr:heparin lyase I family protein [Lutibacter sp. TH_r2]MDV7186313.1 heparin lyase I family protein [Lutibacter sp. TH_r2]